MTALPSPSERERARSMEPIRPIVRRTSDRGSRDAAREILYFLADPATRSMWGDPVNP